MTTQAPPAEVPKPRYFPLVIEHRPHLAIEYLPDAGMVAYLEDGTVVSRGRWLEQVEAWAIATARAQAGS